MRRKSLGGGGTCGRLALVLLEDSLDIDCSVVEDITLANDSSRGSACKKGEGGELHCSEGSKSD